MRNINGTEFKYIDEYLQWLTALAKVLDVIQGVKGPHYGIVLSALCFEKVRDINKR